jgi:riboflavin kinase/FMN adenylyltransferase
MKVHFGLPAERLGPAALAIGSFDGVHLGHQAVLRRLVEVARENDLTPAWITLDPHPRCVLDPDRCPKLITTLDEKLELIRPLGVEHAIVLEFTRELAALPPEDFMALVGQAMELRRLVAGPDFALGRKRAGDVEWLRGDGAVRDYEVVVVPPFMLDGEEVHSSDIRREVALGDVAAGNRLLGREFSLAGRVEPGDRIGRTLGFPTANLAVAPNKLIPARGIYAGWAETESGRHQAAISVGYRPTFELAEMRVEAFLMDFRGDLYQTRLRLLFVHRLHEEVKYPSRQALVKGIAADVAETRRLLGAER